MTGHWKEHMLQQSHQIFTEMLWIRELMQPGYSLGLVMWFVAD